VETLEKMARALEVPLYRLFYDREAPPKLENLPKRKTADEIAWGAPARTLGSCPISADSWDVPKNATEALNVFGSKAGSQMERAEVHRRLTSVKSNG
jgi:hypothetical protein